MSQVFSTKFSRSFIQATKTKNRSYLRDKSRPPPPPLLILISGVYAVL